MANKAPKAFNDAVKLIALFQCVLEQMDTIKGTKLYSQKIKKQMNSLERTIESTVFLPMKQLDGIDEGLFNKIQGNIEMILNMNLDELSMLKVVVDEARESIENE